jgi:signal transduction histidine kinase
LTVPIPIADSVFGYITFYYVQTQEFSREYLSLGRTLGDQAALAIENARLRQQAEKLAVLEERSRLARELHDSVTQLLYSLTLFAEAGQRMNKAGDLERTEQFLVRLSETARQAHKEMRLLIFELRPPTVELEGLAGALQHRLDAVEKRSGIETCLQVEGDFDLSPAVEDELFRVAVEALNNALKHASATQVIVRLQAGTRAFSLQVVDNGKGFDLDAASNGGGMGLPGMRERVEKMGGSLQILSKPGAGAQVIVNLEMEMA